MNFDSRADEIATQKDGRTSAIPKGACRGARLDGMKAKLGSSEQT